MWCGTRRCPARFHKIVCRTHIMFQSIFLPIFVVAVGVLLKLQNGMKMKYCSPHNELLVGNMHHFISILSLFRLFTIVFTCFFFTRFLMSTSTKAGDFSTKKDMKTIYTLENHGHARVHSTHYIALFFRSALWGNCAIKCKSPPQPCWYMRCINFCAARFRISVHWMRAEIRTNRIESTSVLIEPRQNLMITHPCAHTKYEMNKWMSK